MKATDICEECGHEVRLHGENGCEWDCGSGQCGCEAVTFEPSADAHHAGERDSQDEFKSERRT